MTLNKSALLELTEVLRGADGSDLMRLTLSSMLQALVDAEPPNTSVLAHTNAPPRAPPSATGPGTKPSRPPRGT